MAEQWALMWSQAKNDLRIEPLEHVLSCNRDAYRDNRQPEYVPIYVGERGHIAAAVGFCHATIAERTQEAA